jgi:hypothetical protein
MNNRRDSQISDLQHEAGTNGLTIADAQREERRSDR